MNILFCNPPWWTEERSPTPENPDRGFVRGGIRAGSRWPFTRRSSYFPDQFRFGSYMPFPFFLASAAAYVERESFGLVGSNGVENSLATPWKITLRDSIARGESYASFFKFIQHARPDALVIETGAASWEHDLQVLQTLKVILPDLRIAVAGPTVLSASKSTPTGRIVDAWLQGEYEKNALKFIQGASGLLPFDMLTREEMNALPHPMFDEEAALNYWDACPKGQKAPHLQLFTSRGCVYKCCFCAWPATMTGNDPDGTNARAVRFHSPEWIESFVRAFIARHPETASIYLDDDTFNLADKHVLGICEAMKRIGLPWSAMCRADTSKPETWRAMKDAGCFGVKLGFESGSQRVIDEIVNKRLNLAEAAKTAKWLRKDVGMTVHGTFTVGLPGETGAEKQETLDFIKTLYLDGALDTHQLSGTAMIEGTPLDGIAHGEVLKAYPGAIAGEGFVIDRDGQHKAEGLAR